MFDWNCYCRKWPHAPGAGGDNVPGLPLVRSIVRERLLELYLVLTLMNESACRESSRCALVHNPTEAAATEAAVLMYALTVAPY